jgi:hypothetical protein
MNYHSRENLIPTQLLSASLALALAIFFSNAVGAPIGSTIAQ